MCKGIFKSMYLLGFAMFTTLLIILWRISKASDGFASQDEETSFYRWMMVYCGIFIFQMACVLSPLPKGVFVAAQTITCVLPLCLYLFFMLNNIYGQQGNLFGDSHGFSKMFCTMKANDIDCRVEVQQLAPKSISDCEVHNSSVKWDFCGTPCQSSTCLHNSTKK